MCTIRDAGARRRIEDEVALATARLNEAQRIAEIGSWERNSVTGRVWWSDETYRIFGEDSRAHGSLYKALLRKTHPEDRARVQGCVERALADGEPYSITYRILPEDGVERVIHGRGRVLEDGGRPVGFAGTVQDVTERKKAENELRLSEARFEEAQRLARIGNWECPTAGKRSCTSRSTFGWTTRAIPWP